MPELEKVQIKVPDIFRNFADFLEHPEKVLGNKEEAEKVKARIAELDPNNVQLLLIIRLIRSYVHGTAGIKDSRVWTSETKETEDEQGQCKEDDQVEQQGCGSQQKEECPANKGTG